MNANTTKNILLASVLGTLAAGTTWFADKICSPLAKTFEKSKPATQSSIDPMKPQPQLVTQPRSVTSRSKPVHKKGGFKHPANAKGKIQKRGTRPQAGWHPESVVAKSRNCADWFKNRRVVLDGKNICLWNKKVTGQMRLGDLLALCLDLHRRGVDYKVYFDATTRYYLRDCGEKGADALYVALLKERPDIFCEVPGHHTADIALLEDVAEKSPDGKQTVFVTHDLYSEYRARFPFVADPSLRLSGSSGPKGIYFKEINWFVPLKQAC